MTVLIVILSYQGATITKQTSERERESERKSSRYTKHGQYDKFHILKDLDELLEKPDPRLHHFLPPTYYPR